MKTSELPLSYKNVVKLVSIVFTLVPVFLTILEKAAIDLQKKKKDHN